MARRVIIEDDITGEPNANEVVFALRNKVYKTDLTEEGEAELEAVLAPYIAVARDGGKLIISNERYRAAPTEVTDDYDTGRHTKEETAAVREFGDKHGIKLPVGKIPRDVWAAWRTNNLDLLRPGRLPDSKPTPRQVKMVDAS